jgi:hypothetical protein
MPLRGGGGRSSAILLRSSSVRATISRRKKFGSWNQVGRSSLWKAHAM